MNSRGTMDHALTLRDQFAERCMEQVAASDRFTSPGHTRSVPADGAHSVAGLRQTRADRSSYKAGRASYRNSCHISDPGLT